MVGSVLLMNELIILCLLDHLNDLMSHYSEHRHLYVKSVRGSKNDYMLV